MFSLIRYRPNGFPIVGRIDISDESEDDSDVEIIGVGRIYISDESEDDSDVQIIGNVPKRMCDTPPIR